MRSSRPALVRQLNLVVATWACSPWQRWKRRSLEFSSRLPNDQAITRSFHNGFGHLPQRVDFENSLHLGEEPIQQGKFPPAIRTMAATASSAHGCAGRFISAGVQRCSNNRLISVVLNGRN